MNICGEAALALSDTVDINQASVKMLCQGFSDYSDVSEVHKRMCILIVQYLLYILEENVVVRQKPDLLCRQITRLADYYPSKKLRKECPARQWGAWRCVHYLLKRLAIFQGYNAVMRLSRVQFYSRMMKVTTLPSCSFDVRFPYLYRMLTELYAEISDLCLDISSQTFSIQRSNTYNCDVHRANCDTLRAKVLVAQVKQTQIKNVSGVCPEFCVIGYSIIGVSYPQIEWQID